MNTVTLFKCTCTKGQMMGEQGESFSFHPWRNTVAYEGYDDGGKKYIVPKGFEVCPDSCGAPQFYKGNTHYELINYNGEPAVSLDGETRINVLSLAFKISNVEIETIYTGDNMPASSMLLFDLETALGKVGERELAANIDNENKCVDRIDCNLGHNQRDKIGELFNDDIPWNELYDALDEELGRFLKAVEDE